MSVPISLSQGATHLKSASFIVKDLELVYKGGKPYVTGPISTDEVDSVEDKVELICLEDQKTQINEGSIKLDLDHELWRDPDNPLAMQPIGRAVKAFIKQVKGVNKLYVEWLMNVSHPNIKSILEQIKDKILDSFSIAFTIPEGGAFIDIKTGIRHLIRIILENVALTAYPINKGCSGAEMITKSLRSLQEAGALESITVQPDKGETIKKGEPKMSDGNDGGTSQEPANPAKAPDAKSKDKGVTIEAISDVISKAVQPLAERIEALEAKGKEPEKKEDVASLLKSVEGKLLEQPAFKSYAEKLAQEAAQEQQEQLKSQLEGITAILNEPVIPPASDPEAKSQKQLEAEQKAQDNWSVLSMVGYR